MNRPWETLQVILERCYVELGLAERFEADASYLKHAYEFTEVLWDTQFDRIAELRIVMLSEAPFFGDAKAYIYNPQTPPTAFLYFNDLCAIIGSDVLPSCFESAVARKTYMIEALAKQGFLVLDIFPFALNPKNTGISFRGIPLTLYRRLLRECASEYLHPKLLRIAVKANHFTRFVYRYRSLIAKTARLVDFELQKMGLISPGETLPCIAGTNMSLARDKLAELCAKHQGFD